MKPKSGALEPSFHVQFLALAKTNEGKLLLTEFLEDVTMVIDQGISDGDTWLTIGLNKDRTKVLLTLHQGVDTSYATGTNLGEFLREAILL